MRSSRPPADPGSAAAVRAAALRLLTVRARGAEDLGRTLERRGFERAAVREALDRLVAEGWLDDLSAARSVVRARAGKYGKARILRELSALGFSKDVAGAALEEAVAGGAEEKALGKAFRILWRRSEGLDAAVRRRRVTGALSRKGFAPEAISAMMRGSQKHEREHEHENGEVDIG